MTDTKQTGAGEKAREDALFELSPDIADKFPTGQRPGETPQDRDRRVAESRKRG